MNRTLAIERIDPLCAELRKIDRQLDGQTDPETGEFRGGLNDLLAEAEDEWLPHRDACIAELAEGDYKGKQLPGEDKLDALTRTSSPEAAAAWKNYHHLQRVTKRLRERATRLDAEIKGLQTIAKRPDESEQQSRQGLPIHGQQRPPMRAA